MYVRCQAPQFTRPCQFMCAYCGWLIRNTDWPSKVAAELLSLGDRECGVQLTRSWFGPTVPVTASKLCVFTKLNPTSQYATNKLLCSLLHSSKYIRFTCYYLSVLFSWTSISVSSIWPCYTLQKLLSQYRITYSISALWNYVETLGNLMENSN